MRDIILAAGSLAGAAVLTALAVILQPESPIWKWLLWAGISVFIACAYILIIDHFRPGGRTIFLLGMGAGIALFIGCAIAFYVEPIAAKLSNILNLSADKTFVQFRPTADFKKVPIEVAGWMFQLPVIITNKSPTGKLSLEISLHLTMKAEWPTKEYVLRDILDTTSRLLWKVRYPDYLPTPINIAPQETKTGILYFWTGIMQDANLRENLSDMIERGNDFMPVAALEVKNLVTNETISIRIPTAAETN